jgi:hypothetical protein
MRRPITVAARSKAWTLALTSPTSGGRLVGIVHLRIQATEFNFFKYVHTRALLIKETVLKLATHFRAKHLKALAGCRHCTEAEVPTLPPSRQ